MKKVVGLMLVLALLTPAFATTVGVASTQPETSSSVVGYLAPGGTAYATTAVWKLASGGTLPVNTRGWAGAVQDSLGNWYKTEYNMSQYGATLYLDEEVGDGTTSYIGTDNTAVRNSAAKLQIKNGTFVVNGHAIWNDKFQNGTTSRTVSSGGYAGACNVNIGEGGSIHVTGSEAVGTAGGNMIFGYGVNVDASCRMSGNGILSGITRDELGAYTGGRTLELGRNGSSGATEKVLLEMNGSRATVEAAALKMNGNASTVVTMRFITDAGGASAVNLYGAGSNAVIFGAQNILDIQLGAALTEGQVLTLINLVDSTGGVNMAAGKFKTTWGATLNEGTITDLWYDGVMYGLKISYVGGTGNDVTMTVIPEPATLAVLGLGGLLLRRRLA